MQELIPHEVIERRIFLIRGQRVMIDRDLAKLYEVETKYLNRQVKRNIRRFPEEFLFRLTREERNELVTICHRFKTMKHAASFPYAFTEHGVAMLASVLNSEQAIVMSIIIIKTFVKLREIIGEHKELAYKLAELESKINGHDKKIQTIIAAIRQLVAPPKKEPRRLIGFHAGRDLKKEGNRNLKNT